MLFCQPFSKLFSRESDTFRQFAKVDSGFLAWDFWLKDKDDRLLASINRNFRGLGRELFTDTGMSNSFACSMFFLAGGNCLTRKTKSQDNMSFDLTRPVQSSIWRPDQISMSRDKLWFYPDRLTAG